MTKKVIIALVLISILGGITYFFNTPPKTEIPPVPSPAASTEVVENISVELSFKIPTSETESPAMTIELPSGSDHCEVLKKALEGGNINDLDMRYNEEFKTNGVYVISGLGKTDSPWWVYKINGADAPAGCSQVKVNPGDKITWEYIGE